VNGSHEETRTVILGITDPESERDPVVLETIRDPSLLKGQLAYWRDPANSFPFHHDVHAALQHTTVTYERLEDPD
jgi:hypothetical protein